MAKKYDVVATIGTYQKDGQTKYISRNVGSVIETKNGLAIVMDACFNPAGCANKTEDGKVFLSLFEPRPDAAQQPAQQQRPAQSAPQQPAGFNDFDEYADIPFN